MKIDNINVKLISLHELNSSQRHYLQMWNSTSFINECLGKENTLYPFMGTNLGTMTRAIWGGSSDMVVNVGDTIEIKIYQNSGNSCTLYASGAYNYMTIMEV